MPSDLPTSPPPLYFSADRPLSAWGSLETKGGGGGGGVRRGLLQTFRSRLRKGEERATEKVLSCGRKLLFLPFLSQFYPPTFLRPPPNPLSPPFAAAVVSGMHNQGWPKKRIRRRVCRTTLWSKAQKPHQYFWQWNLGCDHLREEWSHSLLL